MAVVVMLALAVTLLPVVHVVMSGEIPILKIVAGSSTKEALPDREHFNKEIPKFSAYLFQYVLTVFGPLLFGILVASRRYFVSGAVLLWCLAYAASSGAKWPTLIFLFTSALLAISIRSLRWRAILPILAVVTGIAFFVAATRLSATLSDWATKGGAKEQLEVLRLRGPVSVGDIHRLAEALNGPTEFGRSADYLIYRVYLGPVEVASRWYEFYPAVYGSYLGFAGILRQTTDGRAPSNIIGVEVYRKRFPNRYLDSTSAYASIDADARAHGGIPGIIAAGLCLFLFRVLARFGSKTRLGRISQTAQLAIYTTVPFQGSLQAILISQGVLALLLIQVASKWSERRHAAALQPSETVRNR